MTTPSLTRRSAFAGAAALSIAPAAAYATAGRTPIAALWAEAETLGERLSHHRADIAAAAQKGGISGWMRLGGEANALGERRYARLMAILESQPRSYADLAVMARVVLDEEVQNGAKGYAADQLAKATIATLEAAVS